MAKFDLTSGLFDLTSKQFYYVKVQFIPSQANFDLTRGMTLQAWSLQEGSGVESSAKRRAPGLVNLVSDVAQGRCLPFLPGLACWLPVKTGRGKC